MYVTVKPNEENSKDEDYEEDQKETDENKSKFHLTDSLLPLQHNLVDDGQNALLQELIQGARELDQLYETSKSSTYKLKQSYEEIKKEEKIVKVLHDQYYNALVEKKFHEEDRDNFFQKEKDLEKLKLEFIDNSQKYAYNNSKYVEYNQRFSKERENQISNIFKDVDEVNRQNNNLKSERLHFKKELSASQSSVLEHRRKIEALEKENTALKNKMKVVEQQRDRIESEKETLQREELRLNGVNEKLQENVSHLEEKLKVSAKQNAEKQQKLQKMLEEKEELQKRCERTEMTTVGLDEQLKSLAEQMKVYEQRWRVDRQQLQDEVKELRDKLKRSQTQCYNIMIRNQTLHQKLKKAVHNVERVKCGKLKAIISEEGVKKRNLQLAEEKLTLINEVLELKGDFCADQRRIKSAHRVNCKLRDENDVLRNKIVLLKENRNAVALLEDAEELREVTQERFTRRKMLSPPSAPSSSSFGRL